jgi:ribosome-associated protein
LKFTSARLAQDLSRLALSKKATDIKVLDVRKLTDVTDFLVVCSASADMHGRAIADTLQQEMAKHKVKVWHNEGYSRGEWILLDFVDVVVHIFLDETRRFYNLEGLWGDAPHKTLSENGRFSVKSSRIAKKSKSTRRKIVKRKKVR